MIDITIRARTAGTGEVALSLTEEQARSLVRALAWVIGEPVVCGVRDTCALYPRNVVAYHDDEARDPAVTVARRED